MELARQAEAPAYLGSEVWGPVMLASYSLSFDLGQITLSFRACFLPVPLAHRSVVFSVVKCFKAPCTNVAATDGDMSRSGFFLFVLRGLGELAIHGSSQ